MSGTALYRRLQVVGFQHRVSKLAQVYFGGEVDGQWAHGYNSVHGKSIDV